MSNTELIKKLRNLTQAGMKDCSDALKEAEGDLQKAVDIIKAKGKNIVSSRQGKIAAEGAIAYCADVDGTLACLVEVNCQTDFVANSNDFKSFATCVAFSLNESVINNLPFNLDEERISLVKDRLIATTKENIVIRRWWAEQIYSEFGRVFHYVHSNRKIGVLLSLIAPTREGRNDPAFIELGNDLAMQVAAMSPLAISPEHLTLDDVARQRNIFESQLKELNKPEAAWAKILDGKFNKWYSEVCLTEQESVVVNKTQVKKVLADLGTKLGGPVKIGVMIRCEVGEGIVRETSNLADEVAKLM